MSNLHSSCNRFRNFFHGGLHRLLGHTDSPDNFSLPGCGDLAVAHEGGEHLLMPKILTPRLELFRRLADLLPQPG
jgi:hypothetical protein